MANNADRFSPCFAFPQPTRPAKNIAIIGAGVAGLTLAKALQDQGCMVTVFDQGSGPGAGGSGNAIGYLSPKTGKVITDVLRFQTKAWQYSLEYWKDRDLFHQAPILQVANTADNLERFRAFYATGLVDCQLLTPTECVSYGVNGRNIAGGLLFENSGYIYPEKNCKKLSEGIDIQYKNAINSIDMNSRCLLEQDGTKTAPFDHIILCAANADIQISQAMQVPLQYYRGHVTEITSDCEEDRILSGNGYLCLGKEHSCAGATFDPVAHYPGIALNSTATEIERNLDLVADFANIGDLKERVIQGRASSRTASPDRLPVCGPIADYAWSMSSWKNFYHGKHWQIPDEAVYVPGLYIFSALGARGFSTAPYLASLLCKMILGQDLNNTEQQHLSLVHPSRFMVNDLKRAPEKRRWFTE